MKKPFHRSGKLLALLLALTLSAGLSPVSALGGETSESFILGVDVSELIAQEKSGVLYYDESGAPADALKILADHGIDHIRLRVWNDPFDAEGNGYGGGNIDADAAAALSARASALGMKTLIDFHYSDFWADPSRQIAPKAWAGMDLAEKEEAIAAYTRESLARILDAGGDVDMVQIGNETTNGMAGEYDLASMARLMRAGCAAVRETEAAYGREIRVSIHLTDLQNADGLLGILRTLIARGAEFDEVALSYYPFWHGTLDDLQYIIRRIHGDFGKRVFIAETSWPFTLEDGDGSGNVIGYDPGMYPVSPEGQAEAMRAIIRTAAEEGARGLFWWGGIWTPVSPDREKNLSLWETCGSGWATRFANSYDPEHVGEDYGGCAWDNQAMFDFSGHPLPVLDLFRQLAGTVEVKAPANLAAAPDGSPASLPEAAGENLVRNPGFEEADTSMWEAVSHTDDIPFDYQDFVNDAHSGTVAFHYWSEKDMDFQIQQTLTGLPLGKYEVSVWSQGGDMKNASLTLFVIADGTYYEESFMNTSWADWKHPVLREIPVSGGELTVGVKISCGAGGWGTLDDFSVAKMP